MTHSMPTQEPSAAATRRRISCPTSGIDSRPRVEEADRYGVSRARGGRDLKAGSKSSAANYGQRIPRR